MKVLGLLTLTLCVALGALFIIGRLLTRRLETEPRPLVTWGHETSFPVLRPIDRTGRAIVTTLKPS